jgi:ABC-2 type transport system permease protein
MAVDRSRAGAWPAYAAFFRRALSSHLAYAGAVWLNLLATAAAFGLTLMVWAYALPEGDPRNAAFFAYLALAFALNFSFGFALERHVGERIREGLIATDMLKPVDMSGLFLFQSLSDGLFQSLFALSALAVAVLALGPALLPASAQAAALTLPSLALAALLQFYVCFLFVQMIFLTHSNYGAFSTRMVLHNAFAGVFAPLEAYPDALRTLAQWLPFHHVIYTPIALWQGRLSGSAAWGALGGQLLWLAALFFLSRWSFDRIRRGLSIQGG